MPALELFGSGRFMPYKFNSGRRHKIPKGKYRVSNWPEYGAALVRRGSLTVWVTEEAVAAWHAPATGARGAQPIYSDIAIETGLSLRLVLRLWRRRGVDAHSFSCAAMFPTGTLCFDIFSPPPGASEVINQVERLSSKETKMAPRLVRIAVGSSRW